MQEIFLGEVIRQRRLELGLTQEELCEGICEPMTISRFENGKQTPARNRIMAILQRLGLPDDRFYALLSNKELEIGNLEKELVSCHVRFERAAAEDRAGIREEAFAVHRRMTELMDKDDILTKQEIMRSRFLLGKFDDDYGYEEGMAMLLDAIRLTSPKFDINHIERGLYMRNEIKLINNMATCCLRNERHEEAIAILAPLLRYLQEKWDKIPPNRAFIPTVAYNYSRELGIVGRHEDALEVGEYARKVCVNYGYFSTLPNILAVMAMNHFRLGHREESKELYRQAFYLYKALDERGNREIIQKEARELLGLILE